QSCQSCRGDEVYHVTVHPTGSSLGGGCPRRSAVMASTRNANTGRPCCRSVCTTVSIRSTNRHPASLWHPNDRRRHNTAGRTARSAALLVGSTPPTQANVHNAGSNRSRFVQTTSVLAQPHTVP